MSGKIGGVSVTRGARPHGRAAVRCQLVVAVATAAAGLAAVRPAAGQTWLPTGSGTYQWSNPNNWSGGVPNSYSATVRLSYNTDLTGPQTIYEQGQAVGNLVIGDFGQVYGQFLYSNGSSQSLNMGGSGATSAIYVNGPLRTSYTPA